VACKKSETYLPFSSYLAVNTHRVHYKKRVMAYREITTLCSGTKYIEREHMEYLVTLEQVVTIVTAADVIKERLTFCGDQLRNITQKGHESIFNATECSIESLVQAKI
jgi:hypothetical protein